MVFFFSAILLNVKWYRIRLIISHSVMTDDVSDPEQIFTGLLAISTLFRKFTLKSFLHLFTGLFIILLLIRRPDSNSWLFLRVQVMFSCLGNTSYFPLGTPRGPVFHLGPLCSWNRVSQTFLRGQRAGRYPLQQRPRGTAEEDGHWVRVTRLPWRPAPTGIVLPLHGGPATSLFSSARALSTQGLAHVQLLRGPRAYPGHLQPRRPGTPHRTDCFLGILAHCVEVQPTPEQIQAPPGREGAHCRHLGSGPGSALPPTLCPTTSAFRVLDPAKAPGSGPPNPRPPPTPCSLQAASRCKPAGSRIWCSFLAVTTGEQFFWQLILHRLKPRAPHRHSLKMVLPLFARNAGLCLCVSRRLCRSRFRALLPQENEPSCLCSSFLKTVSRDLAAPLPSPCGRVHEKSRLTPTRSLCESLSQISLKR